MIVPTFLALSLSVFRATAYRWPQKATDIHEDYLYGGTADENTFLFDGVTCGEIQGDDRGSVSAEWLRVAYHDMSTHNVDDGTGGLDGSIAFELDRPENIGDGNFNSLQDYKGFANRYVSRSDVIAMAARFAVQKCPNGPVIRFRAGRVDATSAGIPGVPEPHQDLESHVESFRKQGFTKEEMIQMVACGHTLGGVREADFPEIVPEGSGTGNVHSQLFDTNNTWDNLVATEYLDGTSQNPLVLNANDTIRADHRIFSSDGNVTISELASSMDTFSSTCQTIFERMIDTVPRGVQLTDVIEPIPVKPMSVQLTVGSAGLTLEAGLRLMVDPEYPFPGPSNRTVKVFWADKHGNTCDTCFNAAFTPSSRPVKLASHLLRTYGKTLVLYKFSAPVPSNTSISKFWFEIDEKDGSGPVVHDNEGFGYPIEQDKVLFVPGSSFVDYVAKAWFIVIAVKGDLQPSRVQVLVEDYDAEDYLPSRTTLDVPLNTNMAAKDGYNFHSVVIPFPTGKRRNVYFDAILDVDGVTYIDEFRMTGKIGTVGTIPNA